MKKLLIITIWFITSCTNQQNDIGQTKSVNVTRYFLIGYHIETKTQYANGNVFLANKDGSLPQKSKICDYMKKDRQLKDLSFTPSDLVIVGIYEFKNKKEYDQFSEDQN